MSENGYCGKLLEIRLHYPADVKGKKINEGLGGSLCYLDGVIYICTKSPGKIVYVDMQNKVKVQVSKFRSKKELENMLQIRNLPSSGTIPEFRIRLEKHLKQVAKQHTLNDHVLLHGCMSPSVNVVVMKAKHCTVLKKRRVCARSVSVLMKWVLKEKLLSYVHLVESETCMYCNQINPYYVQYMVAKLLLCL